MTDKAIIIIGLIAIWTISMAAMFMGYNGHVQTAAIGGVAVVVGYKFGFVKGCKHKEDKK